MAKEKKDYRHVHEEPLKVGDKYICPKCKAELPINQPCPSCKAEIDWTKIQIFFNLSVDKGPGKGPQLLATEY